MDNLIPIFDGDLIKQRVTVIAEQISADYKYNENEVVLIGVLKGSFIFLADLIRNLKIDTIKVDFIGISSYDGLQTSGKIRITKDIDIELSDKDVIVVEDIIDSGLSINWVLDYIKTLGPKSIKVCTMINKQEGRQKSVNIDYVCHVITKGFLVGYGLDYNEKYRNLPAIYALEQSMGTNS